MESNDLILDLVYNPGSAFLPGDEKTLAIEIISQLHRKFDLYLNNLYAIKNLPIVRFSLILIIMFQLSILYGCIDYCFRPNKH